VTGAAPADPGRLRQIDVVRLLANQL
jgi:hypothetical protein